MGYSSGKISAPVGIYDIQRALGTNECDLGSLCKHTGINMWAKYKPVVRANVIDTTGQWNSTNNRWMYESEISPRSSAWFKSDAGNYGITPKSFYVDSTDQRMIKALDSLAATVKACTDGLNGWLYTRPAGTISSPYRQLDFLQYYATAPRPVSYFSSQTGNVTASTTSSWDYYADMRGSAVNDIVDSIDARTYLRLTDIIPSGHIGIAIYRLVNEGGTYVYRTMAWATGNSWTGAGILSSGNESISAGTDSVVANFVGGHTYYVLPVIFGESLPQPQRAEGGKTIYGASKQPVSSAGSYSVWSVPHTTFSSFTALWREMAYGIALPRVSPQELVVAGGSFKFDGYVKLDSTVSGYTGSSSQFSVRCVLVNSKFTGDIYNLVSGEYVSGSVVDWSGTMANNTVITIGDFHGTNALINLTPQESYSWKISVAGEIKTVSLREPSNPNA